MSNVIPGQTHIFHPSEDASDKLMTYDGTQVTVISRRDPSEYDAEAYGPMWWVQTYDGLRVGAFEEELSQLLSQEAHSVRGGRNALSD